MAAGRRKRVAVDLSDPGLRAAFPWDQRGQRAYEAFLRAPAPPGQNPDRRDPRGVVSVKGRSGKTAQVPIHGMDLGMLPPEATDQPVAGPLGATVVAVAAARALDELQSVLAGKTTDDAVLQLLRSTVARVEAIEVASSIVDWEPFAEQPVHHALRGKLFGAGLWLRRVLLEGDAAAQRRGRAGNWLAKRSNGEQKVLLGNLRRVFADAGAHEAEQVRCPPSLGRIADVERLLDEADEVLESSRVTVADLARARRVSELRIEPRQAIERGAPEHGLPPTPHSTFYRWVRNPKNRDLLGIVKSGKWAGQPVLVAGLLQLHASGLRMKKLPPGAAAKGAEAARTAAERKRR